MLRLAVPRYSDVRTRVNFDLPRKGHLPARHRTYRPRGQERNPLFSLLKRTMLENPRRIERYLGEAFRAAELQDLKPQFKFPTHTKSPSEQKEKKKQKPKREA